MRKKGFTLIELIIYVAVMGLAVVSLVAWLLSISANEQVTVEASEVQASTRFAAENVSRQMRQAVAVVYPLVGETNSSVKFDLGLPDGVVVSVVDERLVLSNGVDSWPLTSERVEVSDFIVTNRSLGGRQSHLDFNLTINGETFNFSASSRK